MLKRGQGLAARGPCYPEAIFSSNKTDPILAPLYIFIYAQVFTGTTLATVIQTMLTEP